jgi:putative hydroxymethylpyrimidine transport system substrate-binding protein
MRVACWATAVGVVAAFLVGCGGGAATTRDRETTLSPTQLQVTLDGWDRPETAGFLMARKLGYFEEAGLETTVFSPATPSRPVEYVVEGVDDIGVSHAPQVALAREKGAPIVALGSLISQPTMAMIWLKGSKIRKIADLKGKTIAIPGLSFQERFLQSFLAKGGLTLNDVKVKRVWYNAVPRLAEGSVDAIFGGDWNAEGVQLKAQGLHPVVTPIKTLGFPSYDELVVIAQSNRVAEDPRPYRAFMSAVTRGTAAAIEDPKGMVEVLEEDVNANPDRGRKATEAEVRATLPMLSSNLYMSPQQASGLIDWMRAQGMIRRTFPVSELFNDEYLKPPS